MLDHVQRVTEKKELESERVNAGEWVFNYADYLFQFAISRVDDSEVARDLVQDTFLSALEKIDSFKGMSSEKTWLTAILNHKIIDVYRSRSAQTKLVGASTNSNDQTQFFDHHDGHWKVEARPKEFIDEGLTALENKELQQLLTQCLQKLPGLWYTVFAMKFIEDERSSTICKDLKITSSNYWVIIHRAKLNLRACVQKYWS